MMEPDDATHKGIPHVWGFVAAVRLSASRAATEGRVSIAPERRSAGLRTRFRLRVRRETLSSVAYFPITATVSSGAVIAAASSRGRILFWDARNGQRPCAELASSRSLEAVAISGDGNLIVSGGADGHVQVWDVR